MVEAVFRHCLSDYWNVYDLDISIKTDHVWPRCKFLHCGKTHSWINVSPSCNMNGIMYLLLVYSCWICCAEIKGVALFISDLPGEECEVPCTVNIPEMKYIYWYRILLFMQCPIFLSCRHSSNELQYFHKLHLNKIWWAVGQSRCNDICINILSRE